MNNLENEKTDNSQLKACVLIIDDSQSIQRYVKELLENDGFRTISATDGCKGLTAIESYKPDVVLLDIEMPEMNGLQVLDEIGKSNRLYSIILLTNISDIQNRVKGLGKGADDYITKPFQSEDLIARVRAASRTTQYKKELSAARMVAEDAMNKLQETQKRLVEEQKILSVAKLASGLAHEINNPLSFIQSNLGSLKKYSATLTEGSERFIELLDKIKNSDPALTQSADEMLEWLKKSKLPFINKDIDPLISETLDGLSRIYSMLKYLLIMDKAVICTENEEIDLNTLINLLNTHYKQRLPSGSLLTVKLSDAPIHVKAKSDQVRLAIENIFDNAIDAASDQSKIHVTTSFEDKWVCIRIQDFGVGIAHDVFPNIFEPFFTTKLLEKKYGLGLTIAQYLINANGGHIDMESSPGNGTTVTIRLLKD